MQKIKSMFYLWNLAIIAIGLCASNIWADSTPVVFPALTHKVQGDQMLLDGEAHRAIRAYKKAVQADPLLAAAWFNLAIAGYEIRDMDLAIEALQHVVRLNAKDIEAHYNLGCLLLYRGDAESARAHFQQARDCVSPSADIAMLLAKALSFLQDYENLSPAQRHVIDALLADGLAPMPSL